MKRKPSSFYCSDYNFMGEGCESQCCECREWQHSLDTKSWSYFRLNTLVTVLLGSTILGAIYIYKVVYQETFSQSIAGIACAVFTVLAILISFHLLIRIR